MFLACIEFLMDCPKMGDHVTDYESRRLVKIAEQYLHDWPQHVPVKDKKKEHWDEVSYTILDDEGKPDVKRAAVRLRRSRHSLEDRPDRPSYVPDFNAHTAAKLAAQLLYLAERRLEDVHGR